MGYYFTDKEISELITEEKKLDKLINEVFLFKESDGNKRATIELNQSNGNRYLLILRQNSINMNDFSAILAFQEKGNNTYFKLRRYNGKSHEHTNKIEKNKFYNFHIHYATQRYQDLGLKEESFAVVTDRYSDIQNAVNCLLKDCNITLKLDSQSDLFEN